MFRAVASLLLLALLPLGAGCIGIMNGYLAESPARYAADDDAWKALTPEERAEIREFQRIRLGPFPAVGSDLALVRELTSETTNPLLDVYAVTLIGVDLPFAAVFDTLMLPFKLTAYAIHGYPLPDGLPPDPTTQAATQATATTLPADSEQ